MTDVEKREKVIKGLGSCVEYFASKVKGVMFDEWLEESRKAIALLKAQEPKYPIRKQSKHGWFFYCPKCEIILNDMAHPKYCSECGQAVKWK